jgi:RNA polymerase sigma-70 factor (ECF subfamily)
MTDPSLDTLQLHDRVERWKAGDASAADDLLRAIARRTEAVARKMLRGFPNVRGWADTADVLQGSLLRLLNTLRRLQPASTRHFFNLAAEHVRRELLDLARHYQREWAARRPAGQRASDGHDDGLAQVADPAAQEDLETWCSFHEAVEQLPPEEREVVGLTFYHDWKRSQIAELFGVDERTVRRRWQAACLTLSRRLGDQLPQA